MRKLAKSIGSEDKTLEANSSLKRTVAVAGGPLGDFRRPIPEVDGMVGALPSCKIVNSELLTVGNLTV